MLVWSTIFCQHMLEKTYGVVVVRCTSGRAARGRCSGRSGTWDGHCGSGRRAAEHRAMRAPGEGDDHGGAPGAHEGGHRVTTTMRGVEEDKVVFVVVGPD
jgi:hypothetical protein